MVNPLMLLGMLGLAVPVILHLIQRQRLQPRLLATLRFLDQTDAANAFAPVPRDLLQLLLRLLLLALLVLTMARLMFHSSGSGSRTLAIVLDQSMSMQRKLDGGKTLFEAYKTQVADLIDGMTEHDQFSLTLAGDTIAHETGFLRDRKALKEALDSFQPTDGSGRAVVPAIKQALQRFQCVREPNTCVLVFSDHQKLNYESLTQDEQFRAMLAKGRVKLLLVEESPSAKPNVAIQSGRFLPRRVYLGASSKMTVAVRNFSDEEQSVDVSLAVGQRPAAGAQPEAEAPEMVTTGEARSLALQPNEIAKIDLVQSFDSPNDVACSSAITEDVLPADNVFHSPMRVRDRRQVLLVAPPAEKGAEEDVRASAAGIDLLTYAINPGEALGLGAGTQLAVKRITQNVFGRVPLPIYSAIMIYGLTELPDKESIPDLVTYVQNGGCLCLIPDRKISAERFNDCYGPLLAGFRLGGRKEPPEALTISKTEADLTHPLLLPLVREEWGETHDITFSRYFATHAMGDAKCVLRASNGDPLAVLIRLGRGDVYVQTFSCDLADTSMPRSTAFVPMLQQLVTTLGPPQTETAADAIRVGDVYRMGLPELRGLAGAVTLSGPAPHELGLLADEPGMVTVEGLRRAGCYKVSHPGKKSMRPRWLAVNPVQAESDLTALSGQDQERWLGTSNVQRMPHDELASAFARRRELFPLLITLVFLALTVEAAFGAWQSLRRGEENG